jgi:hypothetical protein
LASRKQLIWYLIQDLALLQKEGALLDKLANSSADKPAKGDCVKKHNGEETTA